MKVLADHYGVRVDSVHAPCLLITMRVWSTDPWETIAPVRGARVRARRHRCGGASTVRLAARLRHHVRIWASGAANEFPEIEFGGGEHAYPVRCAVASSCRTCRAGIRAGSALTRTPWTCRIAPRRARDALAMADAMGDGLKPRSPRRWHRRGPRRAPQCPAVASQPCAELLTSLSSRGFTGSVAVEVGDSPRPLRGRQGRTT